MTTTISCPRCGAARLPAAVHRCPGPTDPEDALGVTGAVAALLAVLGSVGRALLVGGVVRDAVFRETGRSGTDPEHDVDVEVHGTQTAAVMDALRAAGAVVVLAGTRFEVLKVVFLGVQADVAVLPSGSDDAALVRAAARRDFTVNAIAWDPATNEYVDAFGGIEDAARGILRHTSEQFGDDPLRVLRAAQLAARFDLSVHPATVAVARSLVDAFPAVAPERTWPEVRKVTRGDHPSRALDVLHATGWERHFPELAAVRDVPQDPHWHPEGPVHVHLGLAADAAAASCTADGVTGEDRTVVVLAALLHDLGKAGDGTQRVRGEDGTVRIRSLGHEVSGARAARSLLRRIGAPRAVVDRVVPAIREHMVAHSTTGAPPSVPAVRRLRRRLGGPLSAVEVWARVCEADSRGRGPASGPSPAWAWFEVVLADEVSGPRPRLVTGRDLIDAGLVPGPRFRALLDAAADAQDDGRFVDAEGAARWVQEAIRH
ncbi:HD domain-containing protein [Curtobacterium sp. AB451]|uniref:HD domain-containing protein n=1 Tax=unclassified Curtobacterium TaxID=257496 RepID=UPI0003488F0A|nr:HD domain-containing protein [Curtobacterium sp. B18]